MVDGRVIQQRREKESAEKRLRQIIKNSQVELASAKNRPTDSAANRRIRRRAETNAQSNMTRAREGLTQLQNPNLSLQQTQQIAQDSAVDSQTLAKQRNTRSQGATVTAARQQASQYQGNNTGRGTSSDPYKAQQPDQSLVSPILKQNMAYNKQSQGPYQIPVQGPAQSQTHYTLSLNDKIGEDKSQPVVLPAGTLNYVYGNEQKKIFDDKRYSNLALAGYAGFGNALRYSDAVDSGELEQPKGLEWVNYYASRGLRPLYNIPAALMGVPTQPTLAGTILDTGIDAVTKGKTKSHDPIGDFVKKDPFATLVELPGEGLMFAAGSVATKAATSAAQKYSPILYQSKKVVTEGAKYKKVNGKKVMTNPPKIDTLYRGITFNNKPIVGWQGGKFVRGYDSGKVSKSFSKVKTDSLGRDGIEAGVGSGVEAELIYSKRTLDKLVETGIIPSIARDRALQAKLITDLGVKVSSKTGSFGPKPIQGLTTRQSEALFKGVTQGQKAGDIEAVHGSTALRPQVPEIIQKKSGDALKLGDIDVHPTGKTPSAKAAKADILIRSFASKFPLEPGQRMSIGGVGKGLDVNRSITISGGTLKEPKKAFEVVLKTDDKTNYGVSGGTKILSHNVPDGTVKAKDFPLKLKTADYQLLTNVKQVTSFQSGRDTLLDIFPSSGRTKDIVRTYWNVKAKALFKGGEKGKQLDIEAEKFRSLYKGIDFGKASDEKVLLSSIGSKGSSRVSGKSSSINVISSSSIRSKIVGGSKGSSIVSSRVTKSPSVRPSSLIKESGKGKPSVISGSSKSGGKPSLLAGSSGPSSTNIPSIKGLTSNRGGRSALSGKPAKIILSINTRKPAAIIPPKIRSDRKKPKTKDKYSHNFLGNTKVTEITGFRTKESDITVGDKKTAKLYRDEKKRNIRATKKIPKGFKL